jgi:hypothetical protein
VIASTVFVVAAAGLVALTIIALFPITTLYMARREALERDGLARGVRVPDWTLLDTSGRTFRSIPSRPFQLVMFTDHSLISFPSVVAGLRRLASESDLETVVLLNHESDLAAPTLKRLGLGGFAVLQGSTSLYARYNVRVTPFAIFVDSNGRARASSLVNEDWQLEKLWQLATLPLEADQPMPRRDRRVPRRLVVR